MKKMSVAAFILVVVSIALSQRARRTGSGQVARVPARVGGGSGNL